MNNTIEETHASMDLCIMEETKEGHAPLTPTNAMRRSVMAVLLGAIQFGWIMAETGYLTFNNVKYCAMPSIPEGQCILYPGHSTAEWTMQSTTLTVGGGLGALISGIFADKYGRQRTLGFNGIIMIVGGLVQMLAGDIYTFAIGKGICGIASGIAANVVTNYLREIAPKESRMRFTTLFHVAVGFTGLLVTSLMYAIPTVPTNEWQFKFLFCGPVLIGLLQLLSMKWIIESPVWLFLNQKNEEAQNAMRMLYSSEDIDEHIEQLSNSMYRQLKELELSQSKLHVLISDSFVRQFGIAIVLATMQQLAGVSALVVYGPNIFKAIGLRDLRLASTFVNYGRFHNMILASALGERLPRRKLLIGGSIGMAIASTGFTLCQVYPNDTTKYFAIVCTLVFMTTYSFSVGSLGWLISTEILPESVAATSGSIATFFTWTAQFFIGVYFQQISNTGHWGTQAFGIFAVIAFIFACFAFRFVPETRGTTSDQITVLFRQEKVLPSYATYLDICDAADKKYEKVKNFEIRYCRSLIHITKNRDKMAQDLMRRHSSLVSVTGGNESDMLPNLKRLPSLKPTPMIPLPSLVYWEDENEPRMHRLAMSIRAFLGVDFRNWMPKNDFTYALLYDKNKFWLFVLFIGCVLIPFFAFPVLLCLRVEGYISWTWSITFIPLWIINTIVYIYLPYLTFVYNHISVPASTNLPIPMPSTPSTGDADPTTTSFRIIDENNLLEDELETPQPPSLPPSRHIPEISLTLDSERKQMRLALLKGSCLVFAQLLISLRMDHSIRWVWSIVLLPLALFYLLDSSKSSNTSLNKDCVFHLPQLLFIAFKLDVFVSWNWTVVFLPTWISIAVIMISLIYNSWSYNPQPNTSAVFLNLLHVLKALAVLWYFLPYFLLVLRLNGSFSMSSFCIILPWLIVICAWSILALLDAIDTSHEQANEIYNEFEFTSWYIVLPWNLSNTLPLLIMCCVPCFISSIEDDDPAHST